MQDRKKIGLYSAILALSVGILGIYGIQSSNLGEPQVSYENSEDAHIRGHVTLWVTNTDGRITEYRQSDNIVVNQGADCAIKALFAPTTGLATTCPGTPGIFNVIALGTGTNGNSRSDTALAAETSVAGLARAQVSSVNATAAPITGTSKVLLSKTFTNTSGGSVTITEAGIFNSTDKSIDGMFAEEPISPSVEVNNNDALTVNWTISFAN